MTIIQHTSPMNSRARSLKSSARTGSKDLNFENVLGTMVSEKAPRANVNQSVEDLNHDPSSRLDSDIQMRQKDDSEAKNENIDLAAFQGLPLNLIQPHVDNDDSESPPGLNKVIGDICRSKTVRLDGTELDVSMFVPLTVEELKPVNVETFDAYLLKDVSTSNVNMYPAAYESVWDLNSKAQTHQGEFSLFALNTDVDVPASGVDIRLIPHDSSMNSLSHLNSLGVLKDEVSSISVNVSSTIPDVEMESNASMTGESGEDLSGADLSDSHALEQVSTTELDTHITTSQPVLSSDISNTPDNVKNLTVAGQHVHHAIVSGKEGLLPHESKTLSIVLNPEELGRVNVELTADASGKISAVLSVEKQETLNFLHQDLHHLKSILKEIGIDDSGVSLHLSSNADQGQRQHSESACRDDLEDRLNQHQQSAVKSVVEKTKYTPLSSTRRLDIHA